jgi:hypothetical protein
MKNIDILGIEPKLFVNNQEKFQTTLGGFLSSLLFIFILFAYYAFGKELWEKNIPSISMSNAYDINPRRYNLTLDVFNFYISVSTPEYVNFRDPSIYSIIFQLTESTWKTKPDGTSDFQITYKPLKIEGCNLTRHFLNFQEYFKNEDLLNMWCIDPEDVPKLYLEGAWATDLESMVFVTISACVNSTSPGSIICKSPEIIDKHLNGGFIGYRLIDTIINHNNYSQPIQRIATNSYTSFSQNYYKVIDVRLKNIDYFTDSGLILEETQYQSALQMLSIDSFFDLRTILPGQNFFEFEIRLSNKRDIYNRRYIKLQDIAAKVSGFANALLF